MKNQDHKILIVAASILGFFGGIAFVNNWLVLNKNYPDIGVYKIPFQAEIWGTVSDWVMVAVTFVTAIYLIKTFRKQQIITSLEQRKFLNSYLPSLELSEITYKNENSISRTVFTITIKRNSLQNLIITHNFDETFSVNLPYIVKNVVLPVDKELNFEISFELSPVFYEITEYSGNTIILEYEDIIGTKYCQYIFFLGSNNVYVQPAFHRCLKTSSTMYK